MKKKKNQPLIDQFSLFRETSKYRLREVDNKGNKISFYQEVYFIDNLQKNKDSLNTLTYNF